MSSSTPSIVVTSSGASISITDSTRSSGVDAPEVMPYTLHPFKPSLIQAPQAR